MTNLNEAPTLRQSQLARREPPTVARHCDLCSNATDGTHFDEAPCRYYCDACANCTPDGDPWSHEDMCDGCAMEVGLPEYRTAAVL